MLNELKKMSELIKTSRLILRKPTIEDARDMFEYTSDDEITKFLFLKSHNSIQTTIDGINNYWLSVPEGKYVIELKKEHKVIGGIDIRSKQETYDIGYVINAKYQKNGFGKEALNALIANVKSKTEIKEVFLTAEIINLPSNKLAESVGFKKIDVIDVFYEKYNANKACNLFKINLK